MVITNGIGAREDFNQACKLFMAAFPNKTLDQILTDFKLTGSDLRLEQPTAANSNQYLFPVMVNIASTNVANGSFNTEIRLNMQDIFLPMYVGFFLANPASAVDTTFNDFTYVNQIAFPGNPGQMNAFYNGTLNISVNNTQYIKGWMLKRHRMVPQTQQTAAFGPGSPGNDQINGPDDGFYPMQPYVLISGNSNMQINVNLPVGPTAVDAFSRLVLVFRGLLAQNCTATT
jgi:hypothetical protein